MSGFSKSDRIRLARIWRILKLKVILPTTRAFVFAYLYIVLPKIVSTMMKLARKREPILVFRRITKTLRNAVRGDTFPALAARLSLQISIYEPILYLLFNRLFSLRNSRKNLMVSTFLASFVASLTTFPRFQKHLAKVTRHNTLDLTLLVFTRAMDTVLSLKSQIYASYGDGLLFVVSSALIMYSWFFHPERLPPAYRNWITSAANMDDEFIQLLKSIKEGSLEYGKEGPKSHILDNYCTRYGHSPEEGSLVLNQPLPCHVVHAFKTQSCELHALWRFCRGFKFAFKLYGGINLLMLMIPRRHSTFAARLVQSLRSLIRSSCFLGAFIALNWYGVCLGRTRLLPKLFPHVPVTKWDDTYCVAMGCALTGLSCYVDTASRRKELSLFVAPRGLGTLVMTEPTERNLRLEAVVFAASMAVLVAYSRRDAKKVRGIFGRGLLAVFSLK